jgi:hypothetical protein
MPQYLANKPADLLIGPGLEAADFNDDSLRRNLDQLFEAGVMEVFAQVARRLWPCTGLHFASSIWTAAASTCTASNSAEAPKMEAVEITYGCSKGLSWPYRPRAKIREQC